MSTPIIALEEIFDIARGGSPRPIDKYLTDDADGENWVLIGDATSSGKYITSTKKRIKKDGISRSRKVKPGDFLLTNSMSFGRPYIMATHGCIHDGWLVLSPRAKNISADYFYHLLGSPRVYAEFERLAAGATVKNLNIDLVRKVRIPFPPLDEQRRIAAILDQADVLREKNCSGIDLLASLKTSLFGEMFGDPAQNPMQWPIRTIGEIAASTQYGTSKPSDGGRYPILRMNNITAEGELDLKSLKYIDLADDELEKWGAKDGDVLFNRTNSPELVGKTTVFRGVTPFAIAGYIIRLRLNELANPEFVSAYLNSHVGKAVLRGMCKAIIGMANINAQELRSISLPVPPAALQDDFARYVEEINRQKRRLLERQEKLDEMFLSLQNEFFGVRHYPIAA